MDETRSAHGRPPKVDHHATIRAAWDVFEEVGFEAATMSMIAERAGVSRRTLFNHFPHKVALLFPPAEEYIDRLRSELAKDLPEGSLIAAVTGAVRRTAPAARSVEAEFAAGPEVAAARLRGDAQEYWRRVWAGLMEEVALEHIVGPEEHLKARLAGALTAQVWAEVVRLVNDPEDPQRPDVAIATVLDELVELLSRGQAAPRRRADR